MSVVSAIDTGAQEFIDSVWTGGDLYIDEEEAFKKALGGGDTYRTWWLLRPSVIRAALGYVRNFGQSADDIKDKKTQMMGGAFVVKGGEVVYAHKETTTFDNGSAKEMLAAVLGKDVKDLDALTTPDTYNAVCDMK